MNLLFVSSVIFMFIVKSDLISAKQSKKCPPFQIRNGYLTCSEGSDHMESCLIKCNENYDIDEKDTRKKYVSLYCYNGEWYNETKVEEIGLIQSSIYDDSTKCIESTNIEEESGGIVSGRILSSDLNIIDENDAKVCTKIKCGKSWNGISSKDCENIGCCWSGDTNTCSETRCKNTYKGIQQPLCEINYGCAYDASTNDCYVKDSDDTENIKLSRSFSKTSKCPSLKNDDKNLIKNCTNGEKPGSTCSFSCKNKHKLIGRSLIICLREEWIDITSDKNIDVTNFRCEAPPKCPILKNFDKNLVTNCTNGRKLGSQCTFSCKNPQKFKYIGEESVTCEDKRWSIGNSKNFDVTNFHCERKIDTCSNLPCLNSFRGISQNMCEKINCCWNSQTSKCMEKHCKNSWSGIPERSCTQLGCAYDQQSRECYHLESCGYSFDSTSGKFSKNSKIKGVVKSNKLPNIYQGRCTKRSVFEVDLKNIRGLKLSSTYETPGIGYHFAVVNENREYVLAAANNILYVNGFNGPSVNLFDSSGRITLVLNKLKNEVEIRKDSELVKTVDASFLNDTRKLFIYVNTFESLFLSGIGLCNFCLSYT